MSMKHLKDLIWNQTCDLRACSAVPHPTAALCTPQLILFSKQINFYFVRTEEPTSRKLWFSGSRQVATRDSAALSSRVTPQDKQLLRGHEHFRETCLIRRQGRRIVSGYRRFETRFCRRLQDVSQQWKRRHFLPRWWQPLTTTHDIVTVKADIPTFQILFSCACQLSPWWNSCLPNAVAMNSTVKLN